MIAAASHGSRGFDADDVAWLLDNAPGEIVVLRPAKEDRLGPPQKRRARRLVERARGPRREKVLAGRI